MADTPIISARLLLRGGHSVELDKERIDDLRQSMAEAVGHIVTAYLVGNRQLHLFTRDIVGLEVQHQASAEMMRAFAQGL